MKKVILLFAFAIVTFNCFSQRNSERSDWIIGIGVNTVNNNGSLSPWNSPEDWAFNTPIALSIEHVWSDIFSIEQSFSFNKFTDSNVIDSVGLNDDLTFFSTNTKVKWYFDEYIFPRRAQWLDLAASLGVGVFNIQDQRLNTTANVGFDAFFWFSDDWGVAIKSLGKFALNQGDNLFLTNHFNHFLELVYKF